MTALRAAGFPPSFEDCGGLRRRRGRRVRM